MLQDFIEKQLNDNFPHTPTSDQTNTLHAIASFIANKHEVLIIRGYAGTGKTSMVKSIISTLAVLKIQSCLLAPTGRAAKVLSNYAQTPAFTIHKKIYRQKSVSDGIQKFNLDFNPNANAIYIIDEASMLSNNATERSAFGSGMLLDDVISYIFNDKNCKLILIGDTAQLPPIGLTSSPALDNDYIEKTYLKECETYTLTQVVRQQLTSGILENATSIRNELENFNQKFPKIKQTHDVVSISGAELLEELENSHNKAGLEETIVITRSNKQANRYNEGIRRAILWKESQISNGDYIMIVKNNYFWTEKNSEIDFIANGDIAQVISIKNYENLYGFTFANVRIKLPDYNNIEITAKVMIDTLTSESPSLSQEQNNQFYSQVIADYSDIKNKRTIFEKVKKNEYFNALQIKFSYAITCHKAQGGQWKHVFIDHGYMPEETTNKEFVRWLYTAFTRATEKVFLVNFKKEFFE